MCNIIKESGSKECLKCGKVFWRGRFNGRLEDKARWMSRKYCSVGCNYVREEIVSKSSFHRKAREIGLKDCCERCGVKEGLDVHHKDGNWRNNKKSNLETLCHGCHMRLHSRRWRRGVYGVGVGV